MSDYGLIDSFNIDNGELDSLSRVECFTLGVEFEMVRKQATDLFAFERPIHSANAERLKVLLEKRGRTFRMTFMPNDPSEDWMHLVVDERSELQ